MSTCLRDKYVENEEELIERTREGDTDAFDELSKKYHATCVDIATFILRNRSDAENEVQEAYCNALSHLEQYQGGSVFFCWLVRIVKNQCLMLIRVRSRALCVHRYRQERGETQYLRIDW